MCDLKKDLSESCSSCSACPLSSEGNGPYKGWLFAGLSALFFLGPVVLGLVGAALVSSNGIVQFGGGFGGLALGLLLAGLLGKRCSSTN